MEFVPLLEDGGLDPGVVGGLLALGHVLHSRHHGRRELAVLGDCLLSLGSGREASQDVGVSSLGMLLAIRSAGDRSAVAFNPAHDSRLLLGVGWRAHDELRGELVGVGVFGGLFVCRFISGGVVFGDLLLAADLLVRFEVRLLAFAVAVGDGFAVVAGLEGFGGGAGFVAKGACAGRHDDVVERKMEDDVSVALVEVISAVLRVWIGRCLCKDFDLTSALARRLARK